MTQNIRSIKLNDDYSVDATFYSGYVKRFYVKTLFDKHPEYRVLTKDEMLWRNAEILPQGSGVYFNDDLDLTVEEIWKFGKTIGIVPVEPKYSIAYAISSARESKGISQTQLSKMSGVTQCDISRIEGGVANPTIETIQKLCKILDLTIQLTEKPTQNAQ